VAVQYHTIPTLSQWLKDSSVRLAVRKDDQILIYIDSLLEYYDKVRGKPNSSVVVCDLFFTLDYWLKIYRTNSRYMEKGRAPAIQALYERVVAELCTIFNCTVNVLPRELELMFGREMSDVGVKVDILGAIERKAYYANRSELPLFKLYFKNGLAYQYRWWTKPPGARVLAESKRAYSPEGGATKTTGIDYGFFVMSMSRDIYMMRHGRIGKSDYQIFHSTYLAGGTVMAAGSMLIEGGIIKRIRCDSGHYKPTPSNMIALLQSLQMVGVNLTSVWMENFRGEPVDLAPKFFRNHARWDLLLEQKGVTYSDNVNAAKLKSPAPQPDVDSYYQKSALDQYQKTPADVGYRKTPADVGYRKTPGDIGYKKTP
jgi:hypothetical protein